MRITKCFYFYNNHSLAYIWVRFIYLQNLPLYPLSIQPNVLINRKLCNKIPPSPPLSRPGINLKLILHQQDN